MMSSLFFSGSCTSGFQEERIYGQWVEPLEGTLVEFQEDGTLIWGSEEGTFSFVRSTNWPSCIGASACADGQIKISVGGRTYRTSIFHDHFDAEPDRYFVSARNFAGIPMDIELEGRSVSHLSLYRSGSFSGELMPPGYTSLTDGLSDEYYYSRYASSLAQFNDGTIMGLVDSSLFRLALSTDQWTEVGVDIWDAVWSPAEGVLFVNDPPSGTAMTLSLDAGQSWSVIPDLDEGDWYEDMIVDDHIVRIFATYDEDSDTYISGEFWTLDLTATSFEWALGDGFPGANIQRFDNEMLAQGIFAVQMNEAGVEQLYISPDVGQTWHTFTDECEGTRKRHSNGFHCPNAAGTLSWFDYDTMSWSEYDVGFTLGWQNYPVSTPIGDDVYLIHNEELLLWTPESGTELVAELSQNITGAVGGVHVFSDRILVSKLSIWNNWR